MEQQPSCGDLLLLSKVESPAAALLTNSAGGLCLLISSEISKIVGTNQSIQMYKILFNGKISHVTKDRFVHIIQGRV
jgi:hypothetical protein